MKSKKKFLALVLACSMLFITACKGGDTGSTDGNANSTDGKVSDNGGSTEGLYYNSLLDSEPNTLDAQKGSDMYGNKIINNINEPLLRMGEKEDGTNEILPAAAEKYEVSDDGLVYTFHLREGLKWEDGEPLTAKDYEYGIKRAVDPATGSESAFLLDPIKNFAKLNGAKGEVNMDELGVKAIDDMTLEVTLENPATYFPTLVPFRVMLPCRQDLVEKYSDKYGAEADTVLSCGPYKVSEWTHNSRVTLVKNEDYWDKDNVKVETVNLPIMTDTNTVMNSFAVGEVDAVRTVLPEWVGKFKGMDEVKNKEVAVPSVGYLTINHQDEFLKNDKIRLAISLAIDKEGLADLISKGIQKPALGWVPVGMELDGTEFRKDAGDTYAKLREENKDLKALFVEGLKELGKDEDPAKADITLIYTNAPIVKQICEFIQQSVNSTLGTDIKLETMEWPILSGRVQKGDYQLAYLAWTADYNDPSAMLSLFMSTANAVNTYWTSDKYDELVRNAIKAKDSKEALKNYEEAEQILSDETVIIPLTHGGTIQFYYDFVKGITFNEFTTTGFKTIDTSARK
ncbi:peptide ABC transporter substrate-binding protein [Lagierella massiliensis]|uniref:peptide ABC transporter substrate-binding protein n=1 Tax=Lagierella massiliensis TaxID=1689303 RepID=UPI0006D7D59E|nr:peptide ABC transporter substrate-binding protein [Lagierella massiliensis]